MRSEIETPLHLAEHIAKFTGYKTRFRRKKFEKFLRRQCRETASEAGHKQTEALETSSQTHSKP